jgi:ornithine carbamoyltransferase
LPHGDVRLLGQLYDAIDCEHMPPAFAWQVRQHVSVPVYEGLGSADHPVMRLLEPGGTDEDRRFLRQALLISTIG